MARASRPLAGGVRLGAAGGASFVDLAPDDLDQRLVVPRLRHVAAGAAAHRLDGGVDVGPAGHRDDRQVRVPAVHLADQRQALRARRRVARVVQVHQEQVELAGVDLPRDLLDRRGARRLETGRLQGQPQRRDDVRLIVRDEHAGGFGGGGSGRRTVVHGGRVSSRVPHRRFCKLLGACSGARSEHDRRPGRCPVPNGAVRSRAAAHGCAGFAHGLQCGRPADRRHAARAAPPRRAHPPPRLAHHPARRRPAGRHHRRGHGDLRDRRRRPAAAAAGRQPGSRRRHLAARRSPGAAHHRGRLR